MSTALPILRSSRRRDFVAAAAQIVFDLDVPVFDLADVAVWSRAPGGVWTRLTSGFSVSIPNAVTRHARVTFSAAPRPTAGDPAIEIRVESRRVQERISNATRAGAIQAALLEADLDRIATILQEVRRDVDDGGAAGLAVEEQARRAADAALAAAIAAAQFATGAVPNDSLPSRAALVLASPNVAVQSVAVRGFAAAGDAPVSVYVRAASDPGHALDLQDATGAWWEIRERTIDIRQAGAIGDGVTETAAIINGVLSYLALRGGGTCVIPPGTFAVGAQLVVSSNTAIRFEGGTLLRTWQSTDGNKRNSATIRNANAIIWGVGGYQVDPGPFVPGLRDSDIGIVGRGAIRMSASLRAWSDAGGFPSPGTNNARMAQIYLTACDGIRLGDGLELESGGRDWTVTIDGDNAVVAGLRVSGGKNVWEDGIHVHGGRWGRIDNCVVESGDDAFAFGGNYNIAIADWALGANVARSARARAFAAFQERAGATAAFGAPTQRIERIRAAGHVGSAGTARNGAIWMYSAVAALVRDIAVEFLLDQGPIGGHDLVNGQWLYLDNVADVTLRGTMRRPVRGAEVKGGSDRVRIEVTADAVQQSTLVALDHQASGLVTVSGILTAFDRSGIKVSGAGTLAYENLSVVAVPTNAAAIEVTAGGEVAGAGLRGMKAGGASNTRLITVGSGAGASRIELNDFDPGDGTTGVDLAAGFSAAPARYTPGRQRGPARNATTASGAISSGGFSRLSVLCQGGASASLSSITNGVEGQVLEIISGEASPGTVVLTLVHGTGANNIDLTAFGAANYALNTANRGVLLKYQGGRWMATQRW